jgi:hypothetical protein
MSEANERNIIRIDNLDQSIFRIYSKKRFMQVVGTGNDTLRNPSWTEP